MTDLLLTELLLSLNLISPISNLLQNSKQRTGRELHEHGDAFVAKRALAHASWMTRPCVFRLDTVGAARFVRRHGASSGANRATIGSPCSVALLVAGNVRVLMAANRRRQAALSWRPTAWTRSIANDAMQPGGGAFLTGRRKGSLDEAPRSASARSTVASTRGPSKLCRCLKLGRTSLI